MSDKNAAEHRWWKEAVIYQIYPRSFKDSNGDGIGDLRGIIEKVPYLSELGVNMVWLCPVYASPNEDNGYDVSDYYTINPEFGTLADWDELSAKLHERGIKIMMDLVFNHTSAEHEWFKRSRSSRDDEYRNFYIWRNSKADGSAPNNWRGYFNEPAWQFDEHTGQYYLRLYAKSMPDLNWESRELREQIYRIMEWWADRGVEGFRMDTINTIGKDQRFPDAPADSPAYVRGRPFFTNQPTMHAVLREMNERILTPRDIVTVGECSAADVDETLLMVAKDRHELSMNHMFEHDELDFGPGGAWDIVPFTAAQLYDVIERWQLELPAGGGWNSWFWGNHDLPRPVSRFGNDAEQYRERSAKLLAAIEFTIQATPFVFQGEEIGMTNADFSGIADFRDIDATNYYAYATGEAGLSDAEAMKNLRYRSRDNARTPMQWTDGEYAGFSAARPWLDENANKSKINVARESGDADSVLSFYKKAIALRAGSELLIYGDFARLPSGDERAMVYERRLDGKRALVAVNMTDAPARLAAAIDFSGLEPALRNIAGAPGDKHALEPWEAVVYMPAN